MHPDRWQRISALFEHALLEPVGTRSAWLAAACEGDAPLREAVERLLAADEESAGFLETPAALGDLTARDDERASATISGSLFGPYRALRMIGAGGMGEVWLAERADGEFEHRVAIKRLLYPTPELVRRFRNERRVLAGLQHPHIAQLFDGGVGADGAPYFVMEYVEGEPITSYVDAHACGLEARIALLLQVCEAVQYAHRNLVVHRDLKPSNVLVDAGAQTKLLDFGIAKVIETTGDGDATVTTLQRLTPDYAAPEQIRGEAVTTATDVYALGVLLFELSTGARPYRLGGTRGDLVRAIAQANPSAPSVAAARSEGLPRQWARRLRGDLDRIVQKALAPEPGRRYPSAEALANDLQRWLDGRPILARGDDAWYRVRKFVARNRVGVIAAFLIACSLVAGAGIAIWQARAAIAQAKFAAEQQALARDRATAAERIKEFMVQLFSASDPAVSRGEVPRADELLAVGSERVASELRDQPQMQAELYAAMASSYMGLDRFDEADRLLERATTALAPLDGAQVVAMRVQLEQQRASMNAELGHYAVALAALDRAEAARTSAADPMTEQRVRIDMVRGWIERDQGRLHDSAQTLREALAIAQPPGSELNASGMRALNNLAYTLELLGDEKNALDAYERVVAWHEKNSPRESPGRFWAIYTYARCVRGFGQPERARALLEDIRPTMLKVLGADSSDVAGVDLVLGQIRMDLGDLDTGRAAIADAVARSHRVTRRNALWASAEFSLGEADYRDSRYADAAAHFRAAREVSVQLIGEDLPWVRDGDSYLAAIDAAQGDAGALARLEAIVADRRARDEYGRRLSLGLLAERLRSARADPQRIAEVDRELAAFKAPSR